MTCDVLLDQRRNLSSAGLARRGDLAARALGRLRLRGLGLFGLLAAAERAHALADGALAGRLVAALAFGLLDFGGRVELAADQFNLCNLRIVAAAPAEAQHARVAARAIRVARRDRAE